MKLGVCYYPEQWPPERWPIDARMMREAGLSLVRLADFAWSLLEPREGQYNFAWLDQAIETLAGEGLQIILCTPTASPPPWLCRAYPEILPLDARGSRLRQGGRRHYCPNSSTYQRLTEKIVAALASHYGQNPAVVAWQIDNELGWAGTSRCYCETCTRAFHDWLKKRYRTIATLNEAWGTVFWSQIYNDWCEIDLPNLIVGKPNPSHTLDFERFCSDSIAAYQQLQIDTLKESIAAHQKITTNFMSQFSDLDYYDLARPLDFVSMSSYPTGQAEARSALYPVDSHLPKFAHDSGDPYVTSFWHALMRGYLPKRPYWVMEQQCGNIDWSHYNTGIRPGTIRLWTWHAFASGAETVVYFRWRAGRFGQEQLHSGLLHHDASPAVGFSDLEEMEQDQNLMAEISMHPYNGQIAILLDYGSLWALRQQNHNGDMDYLRLLFVYYRALLRLGLQADVVSAEADLSGYKLVILPSAYVTTDQLVHSLKNYIESGMTVLIGMRSGVKTNSNLLTDAPLPGLFRELSGVRVKEWHSLPPGIGYDLQSSIPDLTGKATMWAEGLVPELADGSPAYTPQVLARYSSGPFCKAAALTERQMGVGKVLYLGWSPDERQAMAILEYLAKSKGIPPIASIPEGMVAFQRGPYRVLLNFTDQTLQADVDGQTVIVKPREIEIARGK